MPTTCSELVLSRRLVEGVSAEFLYLVQGTSDEAVALAAVLAAAPADYTFPNCYVPDFGSGSGSGAQDVMLPRLPVEIEPVFVDTSSDSGLWEARVRYEDPSQQQQPPQEEESTFSFDTTGGTQKITQSLATVYSAASSGTPPSFAGAIGFDGKKVEGCEITVPVYKFTETHFKSPSFVDSSYRSKVMKLTGRVNNASFKGFDTGEVLFLGISGSRRGRRSSDLWELTYHFAVSENDADFHISGLHVGAKYGWQYAWVLYEDDVDATAKARVRKPKAAYIESVYKMGNFSDLGIGTT